LVGALNPREGRAIYRAGLHRQQWFMHVCWEMLLYNNNNLVRTGATLIVDQINA